MKIKRILLTGDDGYNAIGIRLLIRALRDKYDLHVAATKHQQSGVGGKLSLETGGSWGETEVDGIPALWVEGTPADVVECAQVYFPKPFDLILSGINLGVNASSTVISSGTFSAAVRGLGLQLAPKAIALSMEAPQATWSKKHDASEDLTPYHGYPANILPDFFAKTFAENMWGVDLLNVNFPGKETRKIRFTKFLKDINKVYSPILFDQQTHRFSYDVPDVMNIQVDDPRYDIGALERGYISITPCVFDMTHFSTFERLEKTEIEL